MGQNVKLSASPLQVIRTVNDKLMSYNVEFTEVTGGTFWKAYTPEQIAGTEKFSVGNATDFASAYANLMQVYPPIDLYNEKLRKLANEFGPVWVRVSGTWATKTYYDFEGTGVTPEGYQNRLTKEQWIGVLDFVKAINAKLLISVANCEGLHKADEPWHPEQVEKIFALTKEYGATIDAVEFTNEPNMIDMTGFPPGYSAEAYARDQDIFHRWVRDNYPETLIVGPCNTDGVMGDEDEMDDALTGGGVELLSGNMATCDDLMRGTKEPLDVYSYHYYNGVSERLEMVMPAAHWDSKKTLTDKYLAVAPNACKFNLPLRDKYCPGGEMWVTESGDAGGGGDTWASTYVDVFRTLNELGTFTTLTDGVIFHNTLASSDYGFLKHGTFDPRPNYFAVLLWNRIMGTTVYNTEEEIREGAHVFAHSRRDGKDGVAYLIINNSETEATTVELPKSAEVYKLHADTLRATVMKLNGKELVLGENNELPEMAPVVMEGTLTLEPATIAFVVM